MNYNTIIINNTTIEVTDELYNKLVKTIRAKVNKDQVRIVNQGQETKTESNNRSKSETKPTTKAKSKPVAKLAKKSDNDFDRELYIATAKKLGCYGTKGVWKCARPIVYKVMDKSMTLKDGKTEIQAIIQKNGWNK